MALLLLSQEATYQPNIQDGVYFFLYGVAMLLNILYQPYKSELGFYAHCNILHFPKILLAKILTNHA